MRKMSKILFMLVLILMLVLGYTSVSKAATEADYTGYEELADELSDDTNKKEETKTETTTENEKTEEPETPKATEDTQKDVANKSTQPHTQAGSFETKAIVSAGVIVLALAGFGYVKYKKYSF